MGLRIRTNLASITAQRHLKANSAGLNKAMERLASGKRINKAKSSLGELQKQLGKLVEENEESIRPSMRGFKIAAADLRKEIQNQQTSNLKIYTP